MAEQQQQQQQQQGMKRSCALTSLHPRLYFQEQVPPMFVYGYDINALPCDFTAMPAAAEGDFNLTFGLWLAPSAGKVRAPAGGLRLLHAPCAQRPAPAPPAGARRPASATPGG
jgi:hypothetical protein